MVIAHVLRTVAVATQFVGVLWALLAVIYATDIAGLRHDCAVAVGVIAGGFLLWLAVDAWEHSR